jgi:hypothetical protein
MLLTPLCIFMHAPLCMRLRERPVEDDVDSGRVALWSAATCHRFGQCFSVLDPAESSLAISAVVLIMRAGETWTARSR